MRFQSIEQIKRRAAATDNKFFTKETIKFWDSVVYDNIFEVHNGAVFITSDINYDGSAHLYTVRLAHEDEPGSFRIDTIGEFQAYPSYKEAVWAALTYQRDHE